MLLYTAHEPLFKTLEEPEWVKGWMDKRVTKEKSKPEEKEPTAEDIEQAEKNREKTQHNRLALVIDGAQELELWLKDIVRIGLLELRMKPQTDFARVAARMVDAKAPGLAGWVKSLSKLNFDDDKIWQEEALNVIAKTFLLVSAIKNYEGLSPVWQQTIRNLAGWSQSTKELLADKEAEAVKDQWLVAGQEMETTEDDVTIQRNWLIGCTTGRQGIILNFGTKFTALESNIIPGTVVDGELVYFPSVWPQRAAFRIQRQVATTLNVLPTSLESLLEFHSFRVEQLKVNPWLNDLVFVLNNARLVKRERTWVICDGQQLYVSLHPSFNFDKIMRWLAISGNRKLPMSLVARGNACIPLGVFDNKIYYTF